MHYERDRQWFMVGWMHTGGHLRGYNPVRFVVFFCSTFVNTLSLVRSLAVPYKATIFKAELLVMKYACIFMIDNPNANIKHIRLFTDSKSSLEAIQLEQDL